MLQRKLHVVVAFLSSPRCLPSRPCLPDPRNVDHPQYEDTYQCLDDFRLVFVSLLVIFIFTTTFTWGSRALTNSIKDVALRPPSSRDEMVMGEKDKDLQRNTLSVFCILSLFRRNKLKHGATKARTHILGRLSYFARSNNMCEKDRKRERKRGRKRHVPPVCKKCSLQALLFLLNVLVSTKSTISIWFIST
jgi:hypothetical protein